MGYGRLVRTPALVLGLAFLAVAPPAAARDRDAWTGDDKLLHFSASAVLAGLGYGVSAFFVSPRSTRAAIGAGSSLTFGVGKEIYDLSGHGTPSWRDLTWDVVGTGVGTAIALGVDLLLGRATESRAGTSGLSIRF